MSGSNSSQAAVRRILGKQVIWGRPASSCRLGLLTWRHHSPWRFRTIRLLICDDSVAFRTVLRHTLGARPEITVVGEAGDGGEAVDLALALSPDVILMDVRMPTVDGVEATREITAALPDVRVVALTGYGDRTMAAAMLEAGAITYCVKGARLWELERAVAEAVLDDRRPAVDGRVRPGSDRRPSG